QDLAVVLRHSRERFANDAFSVGAREVVERRRGRGMHSVFTIDRCFATRLATRFATEVARDAAQPLTKRCWPCAIDLAPRCHERLLRHVLAQRAVTRRAVRDGAYDVLVARDQTPDGIELAAPAGFD